MKRAHTLVALVAAMVAGCSSCGKRSAPPERNDPLGCTVRVTIGVEPDAKPLVGSRMFATATLSGSFCPKASRYKFLLSSDAGKTFTMRQDYTGRAGAPCSTPPPARSNCICAGDGCFAHGANQFQFAALAEGTYVVTARVKDGDDAKDEWELGHNVVEGTSDPLRIGARAVDKGIVTTGAALGWVDDITGKTVDNPTVALYSAPRCDHPGDAVVVEYAQVAPESGWTLAQATPVSCSPTSANLWVAGLRPGRNYALRHKVNDGPWSCASARECPQTDARPLPSPGPDLPLWTRYTNVDGEALDYRTFDMTVYLFNQVNFGENGIGLAPAAPLAIDRFGTCIDGTTRFPCTPTPRWYYWPKNDMPEFGGTGNSKGLIVRRVFPPPNTQPTSPATFVIDTRRVEDTDSDVVEDTEARAIDLAGNPIFEMNVRALQHRLKVAFGCVGEPCRWSAADVPVFPVYGYHREWLRVGDRNIAIVATKRCVARADGEPDGRPGNVAGAGRVGPWWNCNVATQTNSTDALGTGTADGKWWAGELIVAVDSEGRLDGGRGWVWQGFDHLNVHPLSNGASRPVPMICYDRADSCTDGPECNRASGCYKPPYDCQPTGGGGHVTASCLIRGARDYTHANSLQLLDDGNLLLGVRRANLGVKIAYENGAGDGHLIWTIGAGGDFCTHEPGTATCRTYGPKDPLGSVVPWTRWPNPSNFFSGLHNLHFVDSELLVFDNGNARCDQDPASGGDHYLCTRHPESNPSGFQLSRGQAWSLAFEADGTPRSADPTLNFTFGARPDDPTHAMFSEAVGSAQKLPGTGRLGLAGSHNYMFLVGKVKTQPQPSNQTLAYVVEIARDAKGSLVNAYRAKLEPARPGGTVNAYRAFATSSVADGGGI